MKKHKKISLNQDNTSSYIVDSTNSAIEEAASCNQQSHKVSDKPNLVDFFRNSPFFGLDLEFDREKF